MNSSKSPPSAASSPLSYLSRNQEEANTKNGRTEKDDSQNQVEHQDDQEHGKAESHHASSNLSSYTEQAQAARPSAEKKEATFGKTSHRDSLVRGDTDASSLSMSVRGQYLHATRMPTEPSIFYPKKRSASDAEIFSAARLSPQSPAAKRPKIESAAERLEEAEILRLRGGGKGSRKRNVANKPPAAESSINREEKDISTSTISNTGQPALARASGSSSEGSRAETLSTALPASVLSSEPKISFHPAKTASAFSAPSSTVASSSGTGTATSSSRATAHPFPVATPATSTSTQKQAWGLPAPSVTISAGKPVWGLSTPATIKSSAGSANSTVIRKEAERTLLAHPKAADAKKDDINTELGVRLEGPNQHIARPSVDFNKESNTWGDHTREHRELLDPAFRNEAQKLAKSQCSKESPAWRYPKDVKADNPRENRRKGDVLKVGRHSQDGRPMAVVVTGPSTLKTAFYLTHRGQKGEIVDYVDPITYFDKNVVA